MVLGLELLPRPTSTTRQPPQPHHRSTISRRRLDQPLDACTRLGTTACTSAAARVRSRSRFGHAGEPAGGRQVCPELDRSPSVGETRTSDIARPGRRGSRAAQASDKRRSRTPSKISARCPVSASSNARRVACRSIRYVPHADMGGGRQHARRDTPPPGSDSRALRPLPGAPYRSPSAAWRRAAKRRDRTRSG